MNLVLFDRRRSLGKVVEKMLRGLTLKPGDKISIDLDVSRDEDKRGDGRKDWYQRIYCIGVPESKLDDFLSSPVEKLNLYQTRWYNALHAAHVHFIGQLVRMYYIQIRKIPGIGKYGLIQIQYALRPYAIDILPPCCEKELRKLKRIPMSWILRQSQIDWADRNERRVPKDPPKLVEIELKKLGILTIGDALSSNRQLLHRGFRKGRARNNINFVNSKKNPAYKHWTTRRCIEEAGETGNYCLFNCFEVFLGRFGLEIPDVTPRDKEGR